MDHWAEDDRGGGVGLLDAVPLAQTKPTAEQEMASALEEAIQDFNSAHFRVAELLIEAEQSGDWRRDYRSFSEYVKGRWRLEPTTARELMRVYRTVQQAEIEPELAADIGWDRLKLVAPKWTDENREAVIEDLQTQSIETLRIKYRPRPVRKVRVERTEPIQSTPVVTSAAAAGIAIPGAEPVEATEAVERAIAVTQRLTSAKTPREALDFMARCFLAIFDPDGDKSWIEKMKSQVAARNSARDLKTSDGAEPQRLAPAIQPVPDQIRGQVAEIRPVPASAARAAKPQKHRRRRSGRRR